MGCAGFVIQLQKNNGTVSGRSKTMFTSLVVDFERNFSSPRIDKIPRLGDPSLTLLTRRIKDGGDRSLSTSREHAISRVGDLLPSTTSRGPRREGHYSVHVVTEMILLLNRPLEPARCRRSWAEST
jgi:hypothetical protein